MKIFIKFFLVSFMAIVQTEASHVVLDTLATSSYRFSSKLRLCHAFRSPALLFTSRPLLETQGPIKDYAIATTDTAFKHMLSPNEPDNKELLISFLNTFVPAFRGNIIKTVEVIPSSLPVLPEKGQKQTFMDLSVKSEEGNQYIIEMQASRHAMFDERALYYAAAVYARQISGKHFSDEKWYYSLKPVIALQILDYDTNRIRGFHLPKDKDNPTEKTQLTSQDKEFFERVKKHRMQGTQFIKSYMLTDQLSGQRIDYLQLIQIELPRAKKIREIMEKDKGTFELQDWWIDILVNSNQYTSEKIDQMHQQGIIPDVIYKAFERLNVQRWDPKMIVEYESDLIDRDGYGLVLGVEREEGKTEKSLEIATNMKRRQITDQHISNEFISSVTGLSIDEIAAIKIYEDAS